MNDLVQGPARPPRMQQQTKRTLALPDDLFEWAMAQPEGFAGLVRQLLQAERQRRQQP